MIHMMESSGHRVAPTNNLLKKVDYKPNESVNERSNGGGGGGGTHIAATVKNTVRRLLRRTKSHRDTPSVYPASITANGTTTVVTTKATTPIIPAIPNVPPVTNSKGTAVIKNNVNPNDGSVQRKSQPPPPAPSSQYRESGNRTSTGGSKRYSRTRSKLKLCWRTILPCMENRSEQ
ncbi:Protein of unknown function [Cotesia congregata]|uniref:Uncharacterized protein n=1 Tax=Cotesia congregata TaxID=51543 RepID=A0A8J2HL33_COTCN|nr:Protein of unknown function [Cotesia congregata]